MGIYEFREDDAIRFASSQGTRVKRNPKEIQLLDCPYCHGASRGDKFTFAINLQTGQFNCKRASCGAKGNMITLAKDFDFHLDNYTDAYYHRDGRQYRTLPQRTPEPQEAALSYLSGRGISEETARLYNLTASNKDDSILCFPFYDDHGRLQYIKYRNTKFKTGDPGNKEWCESNCKPILFGMNHCVDYGSLIITEGQLDSLSLAEAGVPNAVSVPNGKNGFTWIPHCWDFLQRFAVIIVFGDCERGEITLLDEISKRFRNTKAVFHVRIEDYKGCKDANELLQKYGKQAVVEAVNKAEIVPNPKIVNVADIKRVDMRTVGGITTGFKEIDDRIRKLYFGQLILLTGERGNGKSTLAMQLGARAVDAGLPTLFYSGELCGWMFKDWMERQLAGMEHINIVTGEFGDHVRIDASVLPNMEAWYSGKMFLYDSWDLDDENESLLKTLESGIIQYGCKMLVIDNLMTAIDDDFGSDLNRQQTAFVKSLARLAKEHNVIILLVAHPKKTNDKKNFDNDDVFGSSNITNLCDVILRYSKPKNEPQDSTMRMLSITKNRLNGRTHYEGIELSFEEASKRISDNDRFDWAYGWERSVPEFRDADNLDDIPF